VFQSGTLLCLAVPRLELIASRDNVAVGGKMDKAAKFVLCTVLVIAILSVSIVNPACAQSTKPLPPQFTIQMPNSNTIQLVVENQAFTNSSSVNSIVYYYRVKDHNSQIWIKCGNFILQSNSETTIISIPPLPGMPLYGSILTSPLLNNSLLIDFQVQAVTGYYLQRYVEGQMPGAPIHTNGYCETTFNDLETSDWSSTQTITNPVSSSLPSSPLPAQNSVTTPIPSSVSTNVPTTMPNQNEERNIKANPNPAIPEFPIAVVLAFLIMTVLPLALILRRKKSKEIATL